MSVKYLHTDFNLLGHALFSFRCKEQKWKSKQVHYTLCQQYLMLFRG